MAGVPKRWPLVLSEPTSQISIQTQRGRAALWAMFPPIMKEENMGLPNPYTLAETLEKLRYVLTETRRTGALELLDKAISKSREDDAYAKQLEAALLHGSTLECRELFAVFGDYIAPPRDLPPYPHMDAVNGIDSTMLAVKLEGQTPGAMQKERIDFVKLMKGIA